MSKLEHQIQYFSSEVLNMLDSGATLSIEDFVQKMEDGTIVEYVHDNCPHKNYNFVPSEATLLKDALQDIYVSENEAYKKCLENNGLLYLVDCLMELLQRELFLYHCSEPC